MYIRKCVIFSLQDVFKISFQNGGYFVKRAVNKYRFDQIDISEQSNEDEPRNCRSTDDLPGIIMITKIANGSLLTGKVKPGDYFVV